MLIFRLILRFLSKIHRNPQANFGKKTPYRARICSKHNLNVTGTWK